VPPSPTRYARGKARARATAAREVINARAHIRSAYGDIKNAVCYGSYKEGYAHSLAAYYAVLIMCAPSPEGKVRIDLPQQGKGDRRMAVEEAEM